MKENSLITELRTISEFMSGKRAEFYKQMIKDAKPIEVVRLSEVFTPEKIDLIEMSIRPKQKECYRNALLLSTLIPEVLYVEGKMTCCRCFGIDHAWNKVGDKYIDITAELVLKKDPTLEEYMSLGEYEYQEAEPIVLKSGFYGEIYSTLYIEKL